MNYNLKRILLKPLDLLYKINPELELKILYRLLTGEKLNLENPVLYNEKLQWLKLYYTDDRIPLCVDKYTVRNYVKNKGLGFILTDLLWQGFNPEDIPFDKLPKKFVIKITHGQGFNIICHDKSKLDYHKVIKTLNKWLKTKFLPSYGEWFYDVVTPRIIIEEFLSDGENKVPIDYKVYCFDGEPKYIRVFTDRFEDTKSSIYDLNWNLKNGYYMAHKSDNNPIKKPSRLKDMLKYASILSNDFPHVRVDFYEINGEIYFGEMTFTSGAGFADIHPKEFNLELGSYINLPDKKTSDEA